MTRYGSVLLPGCGVEAVEKVTKVEYTKAKVYEQPVQIINKLKTITIPLNFKGIYYATITLHSDTLGSHDVRLMTIPGEYIITEVDSLRDVPAGRYNMRVQYFDRDGTSMYFNEIIAIVKEGASD